MICDKVKQKERKKKQEWKKKEKMYIEGLLVDVPSLPPLYFSIFL